MRFTIYLLALALQGPLTPVRPTPSQLYKQASPSVVVIETYGDDGKVNGTGSGFIVRADGAILTNYHVIAHTKRATVRLANGDAYDDVTVLDFDKRKDIALIKIKAVGLPALRLGRSADVQVGDTLYALGNPLGEELTNTLSAGLLSGIRQGDGYHLFQLSTPISQGSSGSPVFNAEGDVVGIIQSSIEEGQNLNFAVPIDYAAGMLDSKDSRSLESTYEPVPAAEGTPGANQPTAAGPAPIPSDNLKADAIDYLGGKIGLWTKEDAEKELGQPFSRRDGLTGTVVTSDIYKYKSPLPNFGAIELNFDRTTKLLIAPYFYYANPVTWEAVKAKLGGDYKKVKFANGVSARLYSYPAQVHRLYVFVNSDGYVINLGVW